MSRWRQEDLRWIFDAAVAAVEPARLVAGVISRDRRGLAIEGPDGRRSSLPHGAVGVFGAGKASAAMAAGFEQSCAGDLELSGVVISPRGYCARAPTAIRVLVGEHPIPGAASAASTAALVEEIGARPVDRYVCLISGGASSLLVAPITPLSLRDKQKVTELLLRSGASIGEINTVRKHLSTVKGGRLLRVVAPRPVTTLIVSDVVGDDPAMVGSGATVPDATTYAEAIEVLRRFDILSRSPQAVREVLERGVRGEIAETVRAGSREGRIAETFVIGSNATARAAAAAAAERRGYQVVGQEAPLTGDSVASARQWLRGIRRHGPPSHRPQCFIAGGETTVRVVGGGKGGRNQEFALALVEELDGAAISVLSAGTDGVDGPTEAAGAFVYGNSLQRARQRGLDPSQYLRSNDSHTFFSGLGDLLTTGPTGTNVMDLKIALVWPSSAT